MMVCLSIVIIGYNIDQYVNRCLMSLLDHMRENVELIFVDDGSTDHTARQVKQLFSGKKFCRYIYQENNGANSARKCGFIHSSGQYITFIDGDDYVTKNYMNTILEAITTNNADIIAFHYQMIYSDGRVVKDVDENEVYKCTGYQYLQAILEASFSHSLFDKVYKKSFMERSGFMDVPDITMGDDLASQVRLGVNQPIVAGLNQVLYNYCIRSNSVSKGFSTTTLEILKALENIQSVLLKAGIYTQWKEYVDYHYFRSFFFYVVKNKYPWTNVQRDIYLAYKSRQINWKKNRFIIHYTAQWKKEMILARIYLINAHLGKAVSNLYVFLFLKGKARK